MTKDQIQQQLAAIESSISSVTAALQQASNVNDVASLNNQLVRLKSERTRLQLMMINLESAAAPAAAPAVAMAAGAAPGTAMALAPHQPRVKLNAEQKKSVKQISKALQASISDRRLVQAALDHSNDVLKNVHRLNMVLSGSNSTPDA